MLINCHAHVFNLQSVLTDHALKIFRDRIRRELRPEALANAVADVVVGLFEDVQEGTTLDDREIVRKVLEKLAGQAGLRDQLPEIAERLLGRGLDGLENVLVFRLVDQLDRLLDRREDDAKNASITDAVALLRLALQAETREVARRLFQQLGPDRGAVVLMMDVTDGSGSDVKRFEDQTEELTKLVLAYPGRFFPFFAVNTLRPDHRERMVKALTTQGFVGVKLYPALGYRVDTPEMKAVLRRAAELDAPLLSHTTPSGFYASDEALDFGDPGHWPALLAEIPGFRICFAHFGGSSNLTKDPIPGLRVEDPRRRWTSRILEMIRADDEHRVFTDVSFHAAPMEADAEGETTYFQHLESFLGSADTRDQVLFGTDFWLIRLQVGEGNYWRFFQDGVDSSGLTAPEFRRLAETNNHRFLGLPLAGTDLPLRANMERYVDFVHRHRDELGSKPAPWLLEALRELPGGEAVVSELEARDWPLSDTLRIPDWKDLLKDLAPDRDVLDRAESGAVGDPVPVVDASFGFDSAALDFQADGRLSLAVFNRADQFRSDAKRDPDGILAPGEDGERQPPLVFDPRHAWVKYRTEGHLELRTRGDLGVVGLEGSAEKTVVLTDYRRHDPGASLLDVVPGDLRWPRFALSGEDVLRLEPGDAVSFQTHGRLAAQVTVSWADVLSFGIGRLARALEATEPIGVSVDVGVRLSAAPSFEDDFRIVFSRRGPVYRIEVRKAKSRGLSLGVQIGAAARFTDPQLVSGLLSQRLGAGLEEVRDLLARAGLDDLGSAEREVLDRVAARLGIPSADPEELSEKIDALQERAETVLDEVARSKLEVGFEYEYSRFSTESALLVANLTARRLEEVHSALMRGNLEVLLEREEQDPEIELEYYAFSHREVRRRAWGFSLELGRWLRVGSRDREELEIVRQDGTEGTRLTYLGARSYEAAWQDDSWGWSMDLDAHMPARSERTVPRTSDFDYNLTFLLEWQRSHLSRRDLEHVLDAAALWGALSETENVEDLLQQTETILRSQAGVDLDFLLGRKVSLSLQLLFPQLALMRVLPRARTGNETLLARAMAASMPYVQGSDLHRSLPRRREIYAPLFALYFEKAKDPSWKLRTSDRQLADAARGALEKAKFRSRARLENRHDFRTRISTFAGLLTINAGNTQSSHTYPRWLRALNAVEQLADAVGRIPNAEHSLIPEIFNDLSAFWNQTHHVRTLGAYLLDCARVQGMPEGVAPSLRIELTHEGKELAIPIGPGAG